MPKYVENERSTFPKPSKKTKPQRADHKHDYIECIIGFTAHKGAYNQTQVCDICGRIKTVGHSFIYDSETGRVRRIKPEDFPNLPIYEAHDGACKSARRTQ